MKAERDSDSRKTEVNKATNQADSNTPDRRKPERSQPNQPVGKFSYFKISMEEPNLRYMRIISEIEETTPQEIIEDILAREIERRLQEHVRKIDGS